MKWKNMYWKPRCSDVEHVWLGTSCSLCIAWWSPPSGGDGAVQCSATAHLAAQLIDVSRIDAYRKRYPGKDAKTFSERRLSNVPRRGISTEVNPFVRKCIVKSFARENSLLGLIIVPPLIANQSLHTATDAYRIHKSSVVGRKSHLCFIHEEEVGGLWGGPHNPGWPMYCKSRAYCGVWNPCMAAL